SLEEGYSIKLEDVKWEYIKKRGKNDETRRCYHCDYQRSDTRRVLVADQHDCRLPTCSLDDDPDLAPGASICHTHVASLRTETWRLCVVDVLHSHAGCLDGGHIRAELGLFPTQYCDLGCATNHRRIGCPLLADRAGSQAHTA